MLPVKWPDCDKKSKLIEELSEKLQNYSYENSKDSPFYRRISKVLMQAPCLHDYIFTILCDHFVLPEKIRLSELESLTSKIEYRFESIKKQGSVGDFRQFDPFNLSMKTNVNFGSSFEILNSPTQKKAHSSIQIKSELDAGLDVISIDSSPEPENCCPSTSVLIEQPSNDLQIAEINNSGNQMVHHESPKSVETPDHGDIPDSNPPKQKNTPRLKNNSVVSRRIKKIRDLSQEKVYNFKDNIHGIKLEDSPFFTIPKSFWNTPLVDLKYCFICLQSFIYGLRECNICGLMAHTTCYSPNKGFNVFSTDDACICCSTLSHTSFWVEALEKKVIKTKMGSNNVVYMVEFARLDVLTPTRCKAFAPQIWLKLVFSMDFI